MMPSPSCSQFLQGREQGFAFLRCQHGGRLVEHQHPCIPVKRLQDFHALLFANGELGNAGVSETVRPDRSIRSSSFPGRGARGGQAARRFGAKQDIVEGAEVFGQREMLVDHADAGFQRRVGRAGFEFEFACRLH